MKRETRNTHLRQPQQARSRATLDRLLGAAQQLLAEERFDAATVHEIVRRAGSSVGAFYSRFPDKDAFVQCFDERCFTNAQALWETFFSSAGWREATLEEALGSLVRVMVEKSRLHKPALRAIALYHRNRPDPSFQERAARVNEYLLAQVRERVRASGRFTNCANPTAVIDLGMVMVTSAVREIILFDKGYGAERLSDEELIGELTRALLSYLGIAAKKPSRPIVRKRKSP